MTMASLEKRFLDPDARVFTDYGNYQTEGQHVFTCSGCGDSIREGDLYYEVLGEQFCEHCMDSMSAYAEVIDEAN